MANLALFIEGELVHEIGHAIETKLDLYHNKEFLNVLNNGLEDIGIFDIILDESSFSIPVTRIINPKFISEYQGFVYEYDIDGLNYINENVFNIKCLGEYMSEGYREYIINPENLRKHDLRLYNFIKELKK